jgi:hypothetical protein
MPRRRDLTPVFDKSAEPAKSSVPPAAEEDWSRRGFYQTMLSLFRDRAKAADAPDQYVPFFLRPPDKRLTQRQYEGARSLYVAARFAEYIPRGVRGRRREIPWWPEPLPGEPPRTLTPAQRALGRLYFADSRVAAQRARAEIARLAISGPRARRKALRQARTRIPQVNRAIDRRTLLFEVVPYRAARQFMWNFLREELLGALRQKSIAEKERWTLQDLKTYPTQFEVELRQLVRAYPFLGLSVGDVVAGLRRRRPADDDAARQFRLRSIRSILSVAFGRLPD